MEPSRLLVVPSPSVFAKVVLHRSTDHQAHILRIAISELFFFVGIALFVAPRDGIALSKTADPRDLYSARGV